MGVHRLLLGCLLLAMSYAAQATGVENKEIRWLGIDFAPMTIIQGPEAGTGYQDEVLAILRPLFNSFKQTVIYGNSSRLEQEMKRGRNTCTVAMLQTPARLQY